MNTKLKNIFFEDSKAKMIIRNGEVIYRMLVKPIFSVDTDDIVFESSGGTTTFNITANDSWSMTIPNFVTVYSLTGYGNATITVTTTGETSDTELTGNIVITCGSETHTIAVTQKGKPNYSQQYLTIEALTDGVINWCSNNNTTTYRTIEYSKNEGEWTSITSSQNGTNISVVAGDKLRFKGNYDTYSSSSARFGMFGDGKTTAEYNVYGNIMSLVYGDNFIGQTVLTGTYTFRGMFCNTNVIKDASNLILPATTLSNYCYYGMFYNCRSLTTAPDLPATTLVTNCYRQMFQYCTSLNYIKCLATSGINTNNSTTYWVSNVAASGTFVKKAGVTWPSGNNGIPSGWTVEEE